MKPTKQELRAFKEAHSLTNKQIANICLCSKRTVENWVDLKDEKREIPKLAWRDLKRYVDIEKTYELVLDTLEANGIAVTASEATSIATEIHDSFFDGEV